MSRVEIKFSREYWSALFCSPSFDSRLKSEGDRIASSASAAIAGHKTARGRREGTHEFRHSDDFHAFVAERTGKGGKYHVAVVAADNPRSIYKAKNTRALKQFATSKK